MINLTISLAGESGLALAAGDEKYRRPFGPTAPGFLQVPFGNPDALAQTLNDDTAAVIGNEAVWTRLPPVKTNGSQ